MLPDILSKFGARLDGWDLTYIPVSVSRKTPQKTPQVTTHSERGHVKIGFNLTGRKLIKTAYPPEIFERDTIVVKIIVNQDGRVVVWNAPFDESTKEYDALESTLDSTFFNGIEYPTDQIGTIIYYFKKD